MISSENVTHYTLVFNEREINTIACAMNRIFLDEEGLSDTYLSGLGFKGGVKIY